MGRGVMGTRKSRYLLEQRCERRPASTPLSSPTHNLLERPIPSLELGASKQIKQEFQSESLYCAADLLIPFIAKNKVACFLSSHTGREGGVGLS